ncbi:uncharacterized protein EDB91DRAFT_1308813 [Suillus paluster]|uniref:uncharacterized protein n=1 Tax=Suillus paluster TaxID=48578 RepID=UPI001B86A5B0|nr:uncharacterized protein EDB91DRAFT_1308813 [Suillus paluster]KAG1749833.1 hypothetical protein EDB91DRAFT_1308813 [Suillus paluster]
MPKLRISLLFYITLVLSLVIASDAKAFDSNHQVSHNRFLKKRAPAPQLGFPPTTTTAVTTQSVALTVTTADSKTTSSVSSSSSSSSATSNSGGLLGTIVSAVLPTTATSTSSSSSSSSSSSQSSTSPTSSIQSTPSTTQSLQPSPSTTTAPTQAGSQGSSPSVVFLTSTASAGASATPSSLSSDSTGITHTALIVLIVVATSVGGSIIIWTIIRKWKFGKSSSFEDRMQPIDWQPNNDDDGGIPGMNRRNSTASSFHSGSGHGHVGAGTAGLNPIPDHDFTAGPANLAPVGGYADLARGPSPQPMMQELARGPSFTSRQYQSDQYGVPLHHGGYATHGY